MLPLLAAAAVGGVIAGVGSYITGKKANRANADIAARQADLQRQQFAYQMAEAKKQEEFQKVANLVAKARLADLRGINREMSGVAGLTSPRPIVNAVNPMASTPTTSVEQSKARV